MTDLLGGNGPPLTQAPGPAPSAPRGGGGDDLLAGSTSPARSSAPPATHHGGGGGILGAIVHGITGAATGQLKATHGVTGALSQAVDFVNPLNTPKLVAGIGGSALRTVHNVGDLAAGEITGSTPEHLRPQQGENFVNYLARAAPLVGGIVKGAQQTGVDVAGGVQGAAGVGQGGRGLLGRGFQHEAAGQFAGPGANPFNAALNIAGTAALFGGPVAGALGRTGEALGAGAEAADATPAARLGATISRAGERVGQAGEIANRAMTAPFVPVQFAARGAGELLGRLGDVNLPHTGAGPFTVSDALTNADARRWLSHVPAGQAAVERAQLLQNGVEATRALTGAEQPGLLSRVFGRGSAAPDPEMGTAMQLRTVLGGPEGARAVLGPVLAAGEHAQPILDELGQRFMSNRAPVTLRTAQLAAGMGSPEEEAALVEAQRIRSAPIATRAEEMLAGRGMLHGPMSPEQAGNEAMPSAVARQVAPFEQAAERTSKNAGLLRDKADAAAFRAAKAEPVPTGNTGMGAQEQAAGRLAGAKTRAAQAANGASAAAMAVGRRAAVEMYAGTSPAAKLADVGAENEAARQAQAAHAQAFTEQTGPLVAQQNAALRARGLLAGLPAAEPPATSLLGQEAPETAKVLDAIRHAGASPAPLVQTGEEAAYLRALEHHEASAGAGVADPATVAGVKAIRDRLRGAVATDHANISRTLDDALAAGGHVQSFAGAAGRGQLGGEYDALRDLPPSLLDKIRGAGSQVGGAASRTGPDQWAQTVAHVLGLSPEATVDQVVEAVNRLYDAQRELGKARMGGQALVDYLNRMEPPRPDQPEGYHEALMAGRPADAARALIAGGHLEGGQAPFVEPPAPPEAVAVHGALSETPIRPQVEAARGEVADDLSRRFDEASAAWKQAHSEAKATQPTGPLDPAASAAEAARRSGAARALLQPQEDAVMTRAEGNAWRRVGDALQTDAEAGAGRPGFDALRPDEQALYRHVVGQGRLAAAGNRLGEARDAVFAKIAGRGRAAGQIEGARIERASVAERLATLGERQASKAQAALEAERVKAPLNPANAPARFRPALGIAAGVTKGLHAAADAADRVTPGSGDLLRQGAATVPTGLRALADAGVDPQHLIGSLDDLERTHGSGVTRTAQTVLPRVAKLASEKVKTAGIVPADLPAALRPELERVRQVIANESAGPFAQRYGTTAGQVASGVDEGRAMAKALRDAGYTPWNPKAWTEKVPDEQVTAQTAVLRTPMHNAFSHYWNPPAPTGLTNVAATGYDTLIRGGKNLTIALNPAYHAAVILGNTLKAATLGGVNPAALAQGFLDAARMLRDDPANELAVGAGRGTLSAEQSDLLTGGTQRGQGRGVTSRLAAPAWKLSGYVQTLQRLGLTLAKINDGAEPAAAVADAAKVMGDFGHLGPFEQNTLRRIVPGYDFYKQISTLALRLPVEAPERIAWLNYLNNAAGPAQGATPYFLNPLGMLGGLPSLALPIRGAAELAGFKISPNIAKERMVTSPTSFATAGATAGPTLPTGGSPLRRGRLAAGETAHVLGSLFPEGRLYDALRSPNVHRYDTGEPTRSKTGTGAGGTTAYPGGRLGGILYALGIGGAQPPATTPTPAQAKFAKSQSKAAAGYSRLAKRGARP